MQRNLQRCLTASKRGNFEQEKETDICTIQVVTIRQSEGNRKGLTPSVEGIENLCFTVVFRLVINTNDISPPSELPIPELPMLISWYMLLSSIPRSDIVVRAGATRELSGVSEPPPQLIIHIPIPSSLFILSNPICTHLSQPFIYSGRRELSTG